MSLVARTFTSAVVLVASSRAFSITAASRSMASITIPPENLQAVANLEPVSLWTQFATLSSIPRPSKQEDQVIEYIKSFAEKRKLDWKQDKVGNLVVFRPGSGKGKTAPPVVLQGHLDMVTEKNSDTNHDFEKDPILLQRIPQENGEQWLGARGTTLGADNGIGVAAALALLDLDDDDCTLPPLEALFTIDEETGLTGAMELDAQALGLTGKTMLNLDTEEWGELYVGCAGGGDSTVTFPISRHASSSNNLQFVQIRVDGLMGGHSGINIHEGRANAIQLCAAAARTAVTTRDDVNLVSIVGGDKHNAIPREAKAILAYSSLEGRTAIETAVGKCLAAAKAEYGTLETNLRVAVVEEEEEEACQTTPMPMDNDCATRLLSMVLALPHGPLRFSSDIPDLVETSNNVASLTTTDDSAKLLLSTRSSVRPALESAQDRLLAIATLAGATMKRSDPYPGWTPNMKSPLLGMAKGILTKQLDNTTPGVKAIHAGLECGLLIEKLGGDVDALSFGPTITGAHSPDERIRIDTVPPFYKLVQDILAELAEQR